MKMTPPLSIILFTTTSILLVHLTHSFSVGSIPCRRQGSLAKFPCHDQTPLRCRRLNVSPWNLLAVNKDDEDDDDHEEVKPGDTSHDDIDDDRALLRNVLWSCPLFDPLTTAELKSVIDKNLLTTITKPSPTEQNNQANSIIFYQGDEADALYFVKEGTVEIVKEDRKRNEDNDNNDQNNDNQQQTNTILKTYKAGDYFGELGLVYKEPRAATARVPAVVQQQKEGDDKGASSSSRRTQTNTTTLWKMDKADFDAIVLKKNMAQSASISSSSSIQSILERNPDYADYMERRRKERILTQCPLFADMGQDDIDRTLRHLKGPIRVKPGQEIIRQGDDGDAMYFVKRGRLECVGQNGDGDETIVAKLTDGDYFGELALVFNQPRALTVRCTAVSPPDNNESNDNHNNEEDEDGGEIWRLSSSHFQEAVQDYPLYDKALNLLQIKYETSSFWGTLRKSTPSELYDLVVKRSRPKRKNVSHHSTLSTIWFGMFIVTAIQLFSPTLCSKMGAPQFFRSHEIGAMTIQQCRLTNGLGIILAVLGMFRIPKNSTLPRKRIFQVNFWTCMFLWTTGDSNLLLGRQAVSLFTINAFCWWGKAAIVASGIGALGSTLSLLYDAIAGPKEGKETIPLLESRIAGVVLATFFYFLLNALCSGVLITGFCSETDFATNVYPLVKLGFAGLLHSWTFAALSGTLLASLLLTLKFEKKLPSAIINIGAIMLFPMFVDPILFNSMSPTSLAYPALMNALDFADLKMRATGFLHISLLSYGGTVFLSLWKRFQRRQKTKGSLDRNRSGKRNATL